MLINFTNHPFEKWGEEQKEAAISQYGEVMDIAFPHINPNADELDIKAEAVKYLEEIIKLRPDAVHIMGEMNFTFQMISFLMQEGIACIASTTSRFVEEFADGTQKSTFKFVKFRSYNFLAQEQVDNPTKAEGFVLSNGQQEAFDLMKSFVFEKNDYSVFILKGYAGTGKTTLLKYFIEACCEAKKTITLMASTGRAAAVLKKKAKFNATTIHSLIYKFDEIKATSDDAWTLKGGETGQLFLNFTPGLSFTEDLTDLYIVDEASMVSGHASDKISATKFGSGNVLQDLLNVVSGSKIIFVGDPCQLPPVDEVSFSAALEKNYLETEYNKKVMEYELTEVQRQASGSEVLSIATPIRRKLVNNMIPEWPKIELKGYYRDIKLFNSTEALIKQYLAAYKTHGLESCIFITHSNNEAFENNMEIRRHLFPGAARVQVGDLLMVVKNCMLTGLRNGDQVIVLAVLGSEIRVNLTFLRVKIKEVHTGVVYETQLLETLLNNTMANLSTEESRALIIDFDMRMKNANCKRNTQEYKARMKNDVYVNVLQAKFGYSITLQKAQGGEWEHVFLNITKSVYAPKYAGKTQDMLKWFYTALTRTQKYLYVNEGSWLKIN